MTGGLTLHTGALIALEQKHSKMRALIKTALRAGETVTVPVAVLTEWWRSGPGQAAILERLVIEQTHERVYRSAG